VPVSIEDVDRAVHDTPYMTLEQAAILQRFWDTGPAGDILELGFAHGKGSAYLGALASQKGRRVTCVDNLTARTRRPLAEETVQAAGVAAHVDLLYTDNGYIWWMKQQLEIGNCQRYSLVYLDGAHDWFVDGFAVLLLDRFLVPGGRLVLDDIDWSFSLSSAPDIVAARSGMTPDVANEPHVRKVWELLLQSDPGWGDFEEYDDWGVARRLVATETRQPLERVVVRPSLAFAFNSLLHGVRERFAPKRTKP
jgi:predicted O-methyltransferase YrrM